MMKNNLAIMGAVVMRNNLWQERLGLLLFGLTIQYYLHTNYTPSL
jgi:hypothetical protein